METSGPSLIAEIGMAVGVLIVVFGSIALFSLVGSRLKGRPSKGGSFFFYDPRNGRTPGAQPDLFDEPSMFGKISHGERITDARVTGRAPVDPMLSDPADKKPKDLKS